MKNRLSFLVLISCSLMHISNSYAFNDYTSDFDDEDETSGIAGFVKRHKILTAVAATASCASIVIYNNQTSWNWIVNGVLGIKTVGSEVWQGLTSNSNTKPNPEQDPAVKPSTQEKPKPKVDEPVIVDDQNKKKSVISNPIDNWNVDKELYVEAGKVSARITKNATVKLDNNGLPADAENTVKLVAGCLENDLPIVKELKERIPGKYFRYIEREIEAVIQKRYELDNMPLSSSDKTLKINEIVRHCDRIVKKSTKSEEVEEFKKIDNTELTNGRPVYILKKGEVVAVGVASTLAVAITYCIIKLWK